MAIVAGLHSAASLASAESFFRHPLPSHANIAPGDPLKRAARIGRATPLAAKKSDRLALAAAAPAKSLPHPARPSPADPFGEVVAQARLSNDKLLAAFARAGMTIPDTGAETAPSTVASLAVPMEKRFDRTETGPLPGRFGAASAGAPAQLALALSGKYAVHLAYAMAEQQPAEAVWGSLARLTEAPADEGSDAVVEAKPDAALKLASLPKPEAAPSPRQAKRPAKAEALAYARPDKPAGGAKAFRNFFNGPKAGNGVAIYDISASVVHMPDGSKLEAHSGIGKMADNPRYVHVKMNGPTPPNTYKLTMREKRFHGVEAIRMTPVGDQTMHGRDGLLAHSYLLRGGREESHGCVAFKDYPRFLKAFKQGKVKQLIVVGSMSNASVRLASNGRKS